MVPVHDLHLTGVELGSCLDGASSVFGRLLCMIGSREFTHASLRLVRVGCGGLGSSQVVDKVRISKGSFAKLYGAKFAKCPGGREKVT